MVGSICLVIGMGITLDEYVWVYWVVDNKMDSIVNGRTEFRGKRSLEESE